jgi:CubicO group peptidase (beta-lactamase class C family)
LNIRIILLALSLALVNACGDGASTVREPAPRAIQAPPAPPAFDQEFLDRLDADLQGPVQNGEYRNVAYTLLKDGQRVHSGFLGPHNEENSQTVNDRTIYRIYSMTKPVTAVGLMKLHEDGAFQLDDPLTDYLPELAKLEVLQRIDANGAPVTAPPARVPTIRDLLSHTTGLGYGAGRPDYVNARLDAEGVLNKASSGEMIRALAKVPLAYEPGTGWQYSIASDVQGALIERLSGQPLSAFLEAEIFGPLDMQDTGFWVEEADRARLAPLTAWAPDTGRTTVDSPIAAMARAGLPYEAGGHGLVSTLADYERFLLMLMNEGELNGVRILKPETVRLITANALPPPPEDMSVKPVGPGYGLGFGFGVATIEDYMLAGLNAPNGTFYWEGAAGTWFWVDPENKIIFIGMVQNLSPHVNNMRKPSMQWVYRALN